LIKRSFEERSRLWSGAFFCAAFLAFPFFASSPFRLDAANAVLCLFYATGTTQTKKTTKIQKNPIIAQLLIRVDRSPVKTAYFNVNLGVLGKKRVKICDFLARL
jgi:hypothetical protein